MGGNLAPIFHMCEHLYNLFPQILVLIPIFTCDDLIPILDRYVDLVPILHTCEDLVQILRFVKNWYQFLTSY